MTFSESRPLAAAAVVLLAGLLNAHASATPQSFRNLGPESEQAPARLFQSIAKTISMPDLELPLTKPVTMQLGLAWIQASEDARHMQNILGSLLGAPGTPTGAVQNLMAKFAMLEEGMLLLGGNLMDDGLDDDAGPDLCSKAFADLSDELVGLNPGFARAAWHLQLASAEMAALVDLINDDLLTTDARNAALSGLTGFGQRMESVSDGLINQDSYSDVSNTSEIGGGTGDGGTAGNLSCPDTHPFAACVTFVYTVYQADGVECGPWTIDPGQFSFRYFHDYVWYSRRCTWLTTVYTIDYCTCYATDLDRTLGRAPHEEPVVYGDYSFEIDFTSSSTYDENNLNGPPSMTPTTPEPTIDIY